MDLPRDRFTITAVGLLLCAPAWAQVTRQMSVDSNGVPGIASSESTRCWGVWIASG